MKKITHFLLLAALLMIFAAPSYAQTNSGPCEGETGVEFMAFATDTLVSNPYAPADSVAMEVTFATVTGRTFTVPVAVAFWNETRIVCYTDNPELGYPQYKFCLAAGTKPVARFINNKKGGSTKIKRIVPRTDWPPYSYPDPDK